MRLLLLTFIAGISCSLINHGSLIKDFLLDKFSNTATLLGCGENKTDLIKLYKNLFPFSFNYFNIKRHGNDLNMTKTLHRSTYYLGIIIDGTCEGANDILKKCGKEKLFVTARHFLVIYPSEDFAQLFEEVLMRIDTDLNVAVPNITNDENTTDSYDIWDVYNPAAEHGGELKIRLLGYRNEEDGYAARIKENRYWNRKNMTSVQFKSAVVIPKQFDMTVEEYLANDSRKETNSMHRFQAVTVKHCQDLYNFSMDVRKTDSWGYIVPNTGGKFDGLVGLLQRREVDFGSSPLIFKYDRLPVIDYSFGNWILKSVFIYQPPKSTASSFEIFTRPLATDVWSCAFFASVLTMISLRIALKMEIYFKKEGHDIDPKWSYVFVTVFGAFCLQGASYPPNLVSGRILTLTFFMFYIMLYQFYSGYIVSYLLMDPPRMINNLADLLHSTLDVGIENILIDHDYFVQTTDPIAIELYKTKALARNRSGYYEPEDGMELVKRGGFAYHVETSTAYPIIKKTFPPKVICVLEEVQMYRTQPMHTNAQKGSPFREMLNYCMLRLVEAGMMYRLRKHWDARRPECIEADHTIEITVGLEEFNSALVVLMLGSILGTIFLVYEKFDYSRKNRRPKMRVNGRKTTKT